MIKTPLALLPLDCDIQEICDWLEFYVLSSEFYSASFSDLARGWDKRRNSEDSDFQASGIVQEEEFLENICQTIRERMEYLSDSYPFEFSDNDEELVFNQDKLNEGGIIYIFCLFISNTRNDVIFDDDSFFTINNQVRDLFQACATWAAAGEVDGHAYSFGFPRPDHSSFLPKLTAIYQHFSDGKVIDSPLPGVSVNSKDEQMDVIAWKPRRDGAAGTYYLLGQVATGQNWNDKSVTGAIIPFHKTWFSPQPASTPTPAMFIPFNIFPTKTESLKEKLFILTYHFGNIYYRYCIPYLAQKGLELGKTNHYLTIERQDDINKINTWVHKVIADFRGACVYA
jgi:hypothetical protein